jgi:LmbE family N-acetylglucosaminyl deacetylase
MSQASSCVLVLSPHPDDEAFGCGGMIKQITSAGGAVDVLYMTRGENGREMEAPASKADQESLAQLRTAEALAACQILGVRSVAFLDGRDNHLSHQPELYRGILQALQQGGYRSVFCPWPFDGHADHAATHEMLLAALRRYQRDLQIWLYEVWMPLEPNMVISIDQSIDAKIAAMQAHASQMQCRNYASAFTALAQYRGLLQPPSRYAEAFFTCDRQQLLDAIDLPWGARHRRSEMQAVGV